ncbi:MAG: BamA/TamA family outer membrane protein, partial [Casimicrobiaceae bacterium]
AAKDLAVGILAASPYAAAKLTASEARIDPDAHSADLDVALASGPPFRIGEVSVQGLKKYSPELVNAFSTVHAGDLYSERTLDDYARRLLASGYFASVQASIDTDPAQADAAKVTLSIIEAPAKRLEFGAGYSTDTQYQASASYSDVNIDDHGLQFYTSARIETKIQQLDARFVRPPTAAGWIDTYATSLQRTDIEDLVTRTAAVTFRRRAIEERRTPAFGIGFYANDQTPLGFPTESSHALYLDGEYTWRNVDDLLAPSKGWMANVQLGYAPPGVSTEKFGRVIGKAIFWWPFSRSDQLSVRADAGAVIADTRVGIPSVFLFRTGGDTTVRGYAFESLGVQQGSAVVGGRYYAVASVEVIHWINASLGLAAFVDAGNATDSASHLDPVVGYGVGGRLRTPIGPFRLDVAYGQETRSVRVHFSVGLSF